MTSPLEDACVAIIDDDESFCRSSCRLLRAAGFRPVSFVSAEEYFADPGRQRFSCLLVDIQLGRMSGLDLQRRLITDGDPTPVIFITAHDDPAARAEALRNGCAGFFRKTDDGARILKALRDAVPA